MTNSPPENEAPVALRASRELSLREPQGQVPGAVAAAPVAASPGQAAGDNAWLSNPAFAVTGLAVLLAGGWVLQRRHRFQQRMGQQPDAAPAEPQSAAGEASPGQPVEGMEQVAAQLAAEPVAMQPQQTFPAPLEQNQQRHSHRMGVRAQKRLIKSLMWVRTVAGAAAILAAIAIVVFWSIETTDLRAGDTGLTMPLLVLLLAGWASSWGAGQLANLLHRAFFGRVHPKFDN